MSGATTGNAGINNVLAAINAGWANKFGSANVNRIDNRTQAVISIWVCWKHDVTIDHAFNRLFIRYAGQSMNENYSTILALAALAERNAGLHKFKFIWQHFTEVLAAKAMQAGKPWSMVACLNQTDVQAASAVFTADYWNNVPLLQYELPTKLLEGEEQIEAVVEEVPAIEGPLPLRRHRRAASAEFFGPPTNRVRLE